MLQQANKKRDGMGLHSADVCSGSWRGGCACSEFSTLSYEIREEDIGGARRPGPTCLWAPTHRHSHIITRTRAWTHAWTHYMQWRACARTLALTHTNTQKPTNTKIYSWIYSHTRTHTRMPHGHTHRHVSMSVHNRMQCTHGYVGMHPNSHWDEQICQTHTNTQYTHQHTLTFRQICC